MGLLECDVEEPEDGGRRLVRNVGVYLPDYTAAEVCSL
jgi:hypothetical protein